MQATAPAILALLASWPAAAQQSDNVQPSTAPAPESSAPFEAEEDPWSFSLSAYAYFVPDDRNYVQPTLTVDHDWLHLEARYNYEDYHTASTWIGYNFNIGDAFTLDFTPMVGGVFGDTRGIAPGYEITLAWRNFELYTEGEFVFDTDDSSNDFFYSWTELTYSPNDWLHAGVAAQRTKIRASDSDIQIGPVIGVSYKSLEFSAIVLFADGSDPTVVFGLSIEY